MSVCDMVMFLPELNFDSKGKRLLKDKKKKN